jgi:Tol biopolymer transport system component
MTIAAGAKFGPYEILAPLGAGGMGEVYRAKDTRLDRFVAIKVLSSDLSLNPDLRQRFEREARAVSSLNHPNICTLHDVGQQDGIEYLVMELIEGETLGSRLLKGPLTTAELLRYSIQISDALDKAHKRGIIHRDLKPGNIMLTKAGVKLLDFGLAKMSDEKISADVSQLATKHRELTQEGTILGTLQYMAPEQLEGKETDSRTDIFALGSVIYEMATGKKAFEGSSQASLIAAILKEEPTPLSQIQPLTPPILERLVKICLEKDPEDRWQNAHDVCNELRWIQESSGSQTSMRTTPMSPAMAGKSNWPGWIAAGIIAVALIGFGLWKYFQRPKSPTAPEIRFLIAPEGGISFAGNFAGYPDFAVSHDGTRLVYAATDSTGKNQLWLRPLASLTAMPIAGTENALTPFWSPDDLQIAFFSEGAMRKITLPAGTSQTICNVQGDTFGGNWLKDGTIVYASENSGLKRVSSNGGTSQVVTTLDKSHGEIVHSYPVILPDGNHFVYTIDSDQSEYRGIFLGSLNSKTAVRLLDSRYKVNYVNPGYLIFVRGTSVFSQQFQIEPPKLLGEPSEIANQLTVSSAANNAPITASFNGTILYRGGGSWAKTQLAWFDRNGKPLGKIGTVESDISVRLSPDGARAVVASTTGPSFRSGAGEESVNIWTIDLKRGVRTRVTLEPAISDENPIWSPDGRFFVFASHRNADRASIIKKASSGEGQDQLLFGGGPSNPHPEDWSQDGKFILLHENGKRMDLTALPLNENNPKPIPFVSSMADDAQGQFSPDVRWVAYTSVESGQNEVYVRPFPHGDDKWQISSAGGSEPRWRGDGKELFYLSPDGVMMSVSISAGSAFNAASPITLFKTLTQPIAIGAWGGAAQYDVTKDGSKFLINTIVVPPTPSNLYVIVNWHPQVSTNP